MTSFDAPSVALIGAGRMGAALARGWAAAVRRGGGLTLSVVDPKFDSDLAAELDTAGATINPPAPGAADVVVMAVKPTHFAEAAASAAPFIGPGTLGISVMAGVALRTLEARLNTPRVVRAMPNIAGQTGVGVTGFVAAGACTEADRELTHLLLSPLGLVEELAEERLIDIVTAVSGSGPAYVFLMAEALAAAGEREGLPADIAARLARQTVAGAGALMLSDPASASDLRKRVTSPGGTTQAALDVLQGPDGLGPMICRAVAAAAARSRELGRESLASEESDI